MPQGQNKRERRENARKHIGDGHGAAIVACRIKHVIPSERKAVKEDGLDKTHMLAQGFMSQKYNQEC